MMTNWMTTQLVMIGYKFAQRTACNTSVSLECKEVMHSSQLCCSSCLEELLNIRSETGLWTEIYLTTSDFRAEMAKMQRFGGGGQITRRGKNQDARRADRMNLTMTLPDDTVCIKKNDKRWPKRHAECHPKLNDDPKLTAELMLHDGAQGLSPESSNVEDREVEAIGDEELVAGQACM